jgi:hypothetical protein
MSIRCIEKEIKVEKVTFDELETDKKYNGYIVYDDSKTEKARFKKEEGGSLFIFEPGLRSRGYRIYQRLEGGVLLFNDKVIEGFRIQADEKLSPAEKYANDLLKWRKYILTYLIDGIWPELESEVESITPERIDAFRKCGASDPYDAWQQALDFGLPRIEGYKTITLTSCRVPEITHKRIKEAIKEKRDFNEFWRGRYDYSASGKTSEDSGYRMWFSAEYKNCGNGHYYLLLDDNHAIFAEDD